MFTTIVFSSSEDFFILSISIPNRDLPFIGTSALGIESVNGLRRVPNPAAKISMFIILLCYDTNIQFTKLNNFFFSYNYFIDLYNTMLVFKNYMLFLIYCVKYFLYLCGVKNLIIMEENKPIYHHDVLEFVTVAVQYCAFLESIEEKTAKRFWIF